ncbi:hypothetical protein [uncultured Herbaspirillum sp.]|uniref:hypothetical protein n=1 Tax=uncultured Herbaspirillum sp. TaxID=160236 RepID=UPI002584B406|nr:hypothetical protein [uncultured Herbaspirillum sp.]
MLQDLLLFLGLLGLVCSIGMRWLLPTDAEQPSAPSSDEFNAAMRGASVPAHPVRSTRLMRPGSSAPSSHVAWRGARQRRCR